ncbi:MAG TPA: crossover junction endodeoxyribonuclease RuvC [Methylomirabilota bacterium]|nr:crossover junction endodeoxyribonuclease RuvC [Methylomirabilota bacterium]
MLGIDPALVFTGYAVLEAGAGLSILDAGIVETNPRTSLDDRIHHIYGEVWRLIDKHAPEGVALEGLYAAYSFPRTALLMAHARGVVCLAARQRGVPVLTLAPAEVKRAVTGNGAAGKEQVQRSVQHLLALADLPRPSHVADALALAFTALSRRGPVR